MRSRRLWIPIAATAVLVVGASLLWSWIVPDGRLGTMDEVRERLNRGGFYQFTDRPEETVACKRKAQRWRFVSDPTCPEDAWIDVYVGLGSEEVFAAVTQSVQEFHSVEQEKALSDVERKRLRSRELAATSALCALFDTGNRKYHCMRNAPEKWRKWYPDQNVYYKVYRRIEMQCSVLDDPGPPKTVIRTYRLFPLGT